MQNYSSIDVALALALASVVVLSRDVEIVNERFWCESVALIEHIQVWKDKSLLCGLWKT